MAAEGASATVDLVTKSHLSLTGASGKTGLYYDADNEVKTIIQDLADSGKTMMIVTHEMDFAKTIANRVFYLDQGGIYEEGTPEEVFDNPKKERTIAFMKRTKNFNWDVDVSDVNISEILDALFEYSRKNGITKGMTYRLALLVEEMLVGILNNNKESITRLNLFIEYNTEEYSPKVNFYVDGIDKEQIPYDELQGKIFRSYCNNTRLVENDEGYDLHISFEVNP